MGRYNERGRQAGGTERARLPVIRLAFLGAVFVDPLPADRAHIAVSGRRFAADPRPDADGEQKNRSGDDTDHQ